MSTETLPGPLGEARAASTAAGGTALTSSAGRIRLPLGTKQIELIPRNFAGGANVVQFNLNPWLTVLMTKDAGVTVDDFSVNMQDGDTTTSMGPNALNTFANGDAIYVGSWVPFGGVVVDMKAGSVNATASVLTVRYWNGGVWTDISATDGTDSGGATMAVDGNVTWTVPAAWRSVSLVQAEKYEPSALVNGGIGLTDQIYWTRWEVSAAVDAATTIDGMLPINRNTAYAELPSGLARELAATVGPGGITSVTALTDTGTANLIVNCYTRLGKGFA